MIGELSSYESQPFKFSPDGPSERFVARYPTVDEMFAQREAFAALSIKKDKPGDPDPVPNRVGFLRDLFDRIDGAQRVGDVHHGYQFRLRREQLLGQPRSIPI